MKSIIYIIILTAYFSCQTLAPDNSNNSNIINLNTDLNSFKKNNLNEKTWIVNRNYDLGGMTYRIPKEVTLKFNGGSISNGVIVGNNTKIENNTTKQIFSTNLSLKGNFIYDTFYPEWYGAKGDGISDDYKAINTTFKNANHITFTNKYNIGTDSHIVINKFKKYTIMGNGSVITNNSKQHLNKALFYFQKLDSLIINGLEIDGKNKIAHTIWINNVKDVELKNISIKNLLNISPGYRGIGIRIDIEDRINFNADNVSIKNIGGGQDGIISSSLGIARALYININQERIKENIVSFKNSTFEWVYGDDGDIIDIIDQNYTTNSKNLFTFKNCDIKYASRRLVKGSASGIQYYNCRFDTASEKELTKKMNGIKPQPAGGVNFRNANSKDYPNFRNKNGKMIDCEYKNSGNLKIGLGNNLIMSYADEIEIKGTTFSNSSIRIQTLTGSFTITNNKFLNSNIDINTKKWTDKMSFISSNTAHYKAPIDPFALITVDNVFKNVTISSNKIFSDETGDNNFFGLLRHVNSFTNGKNIIVSKNELVRKNAKRKELFISTVNWDNTCKIFDNNNNQKGMSSGSNFTSGAKFNGKSWNNRDGNGKVVINQ